MTITMRCLLSVPAVLIAALIGPAMAAPAGLIGPRDSGIVLAQGQQEMQGPAPSQPQQQQQQQQQQQGQQPQDQQQQGARTKKSQKKNARRGSGGAGAAGNAGAMRRAKDYIPQEYQGYMGGGGIPGR